MWEKFNQKFQIDLVKMSISHTYFMIAQFFHKGIQSLDATVDKNIIRHMKNMFRIFCLDVILKDGFSLAMAQHLSSKHFRMVSDLL